MNTCSLQKKDEWGKKILARMESYMGLVAEEAIYHSIRTADFGLNKKN